MKINLKKSLELAEKATPQTWMAVTSQDQPEPFYRGIVCILSATGGNYVSVVSADGSAVPLDHAQQVANAEHIAYNANRARVKEMVMALKEARALAGHAREHCLCGAQNTWQAWLAKWGKDE